MMRQGFWSAICLAAIVLNLSFWYLLLDLGDFFAHSQLSPLTLLICVAGWAGAGAVSCLFLGKHMAQWTMKVNLYPFEEADPKATAAHAVLLKAIAQLGLKSTPAFGVYERPEINAFVVGASVKYGLVAVSRGLIENLSAEELEAILVRELCQLASGDTRVIALMQGMCFAFTLYVARMLSFLLGTSLRTSEDDASSSSDSMELLLMIGLTLLLTLPGALLLSRFSRSSALRADRQAALKGQVPALLAAFHILKGSRLEQIRREPFSDGAKLLNRPLPSWFPTWFTQADLGHRLKELSKLNTGRS